MTVMRFIRDIEQADFLDAAIRAQAQVVDGEPALAIQNPQPAQRMAAQVPSGFLTFTHQNMVLACCQPARITERSRFPEDTVASQIHKPADLGVDN